MHSNYKENKKVLEDDYEEEDSENRNRGKLGRIEEEKIDRSNGKDSSRLISKEETKKSDSNSEGKKVDESLEEVFHDALDFIPSYSFQQNQTKKGGLRQIKVCQGEDEEELKEMNEAIQLTPRDDSD